MVRKQPVYHRSSLCVSAVATAAVNAARSAASQRTPQGCSLNTSSLLKLITPDILQQSVSQSVRVSAVQQGHWVKMKESCHYFSVLSHSTTPDFNYCYYCYH